MFVCMCGEAGVCEFANFRLFRVFFLQVCMSLLALFSLFVYLCVYVCVFAKADYEILFMSVCLVLSQTLDIQTLEKTHHRQTNTRHDKP